MHWKTKHVLPLYNQDGQAMYFMNQPTEPNN